jgi:hypothetical protein
VLLGGCMAGDHEKAGRCWEPGSQKGQMSQRARRANTANFALTRAFAS